MAPRRNSEKEVLSMGSGKAALQLHLPNWLDEGFSVTAHDKDETRLDPAQFPDAAHQAFLSGRLKTSSDIYRLKKNPDVLDVVTSSGQHVNALEQFLDMADHRGFGMPKAILIEKPITSSSEETARLQSLIDSGDLNKESIFVNENYNASRGVERVKQIIEEQEALGNGLVGVDVAFSKNRVPDVLAGRFTDPALGAYGIELPHQLAIAYNLVDKVDNDHMKVIQNDYYQNINGVEHSEGTFTELETEDGITIRLAQGLGPFFMHPDGAIADQDPGITRFAVAHFKDGSMAKVLFDPVPGVPRLHSVVEWQDNRIIIPDNTLRNVIGSVARYAAGLGRDPNTTGLSVDAAIDYGESLNLFHMMARRK